MEEKSVLIPKIELENEVPVTPKKDNSKVLVITLSILGFFVAILVYFGISGFLIYKKGMNLYASAQKLEASVKSQNLNNVKNDLEATEKDLISLRSSFKLIAWTKIFPFVGGYVSDAEHALNAGAE
jgi:membrane-anchored glycerophosphoryl diester phosphodiesterase (GDPDase)